MKNEITGIIEDRVTPDGFLLIASYFGLYRYDQSGQKYRIYKWTNGYRFVMNL